MITKDQRWIKVARCKTCVEPFAGHIVPLTVEEGLESAQAESDLRTLLGIHERFDRYAAEGHAVTVEPYSETLRLGCKCPAP